MYRQDSVGVMELLNPCWRRSNYIRERTWVAGPNESLRPIQIEIKNTRFECLSQVVRALEGSEADICDFAQGYDVQTVLEALLLQK